MYLLVQNCPLITIALALGTVRVLATPFDQRSFSPASNEVSHSILLQSRSYADEIPLLQA